MTKGQLYIIIPTTQQLVLQSVKGCYDCCFTFGAAVSQMAALALYIDIVYANVKQATLPPTTITISAYRILPSTLKSTNR